MSDLNEAMSNLSNVGGGSNKKTFAKWYSENNCECLDTLAHIFLVEESRGYGYQDEEIIKIIGPDDSDRSQRDKRLTVMIANFDAIIWEMASFVEQENYEGFETFVHVTRVLLEAANVPCIQSGLVYLCMGWEKGKDVNDWASYWLNADAATTNKHLYLFIWFALHDIAGTGGAWIRTLTEEYKVSEMRKLIRTRDYWLTLDLDSFKK